MKITFIVSVLRGLRKVMLKLETTEMARSLESDKSEVCLPEEFQLPAFTLVKYPMNIFKHKKGSRVGDSASVRALPQHSFAFSPCHKRVGGKSRVQGLTYNSNSWRLRQENYCELPSEG